MRKGTQGWIILAAVSGLGLLVLLGLAKRFSLIPQAQQAQTQQPMYHFDHIQQ